MQFPPLRSTPEHTESLVLIPVFTYQDGGSIRANFAGTVRVPLGCHRRCLSCHTSRLCMLLQQRYAPYGCCSGRMLGWGQLANTPLVSSKVYFQLLAMFGTVVVPCSWVVAVKADIASLQRSNHPSNQVASQTNSCGRPLASIMPCGSTFE